jgi:hypothetical protein
MEKKPKTAFPLSIPLNCNFILREREDRHSSVFPWEASLFDSENKDGIWSITAFGSTPQEAVQRLGAQLSQNAQKWFENKPLRQGLQS